MTTGLNEDHTDAAIGTNPSGDQDTEMREQFEKMTLEDDNEDSLPAFDRSTHEKADMIMAYSTLPGGSSGLNFKVPMLMSWLWLHSFYFFFLQGIRHGGIVPWAVGLLGL